MEFQNHRADVQPEDQLAAHKQREAERNELRQHHLAKISGSQLAETSAQDKPSVDEEIQTESKPKPRARKKTKTAA